MKQKNVQANFQMLDSYIKDFNIHTIKKINNSEKMEVKGSVGFGISSIDSNGEIMKSQIELVNDIKVEIDKEECVTIHISIVGLFVCNKNEETNEDKFIEMLKLNGATTLSHLTRAYVYTATGLSGMPQIITPMINFAEFFENTK